MLKRNLMVLTAVLLSGVSGLAQSVFPNHCDNQAPLPFASIALAHPIDGNCGIKGLPSSSANSQLQNSVKNNFCATVPNRKPETYTPQMLIDLQRNNHIPSGQGQEPSDRTNLQRLGEGKGIRMKAYLIEAHHADLGSGESVNCKGLTEELNDIHMALGSQPNTQECDSVSGEISPHYRPSTWNDIGHFEVYNSATRTYTVNQGMAARLQAHPYRITGQLFFDASHTPCPCGTSNCNPVRASVWEIHPIYNIEVCKAGTPCNENDDNNWLAFDTWWKALVPIRPVKPPHSHKPHEKK